MLKCGNMLQKKMKQVEEYISKTKFEELMHKKSRNYFDLYYADKIRDHYNKAVGYSLAADEARDFPSADVQPVTIGYVEEIDRLNAKLDELGHDFNNMVSTVGYMEEQVKNYETQSTRLDEENQSLRILLREIQPILYIAFFANFKDTNKANELYDKITQIVGKE